MPKTDIKQWCTNNQYELLELEKTSTSETEEEDDDDDDDAAGESNHRTFEIRKEMKVSRIEFRLLC